MEPPPLSGRGGGSPFFRTEAGGAEKPAGVARVRAGARGGRERPVPRAAIG